MYFGGQTINHEYFPKRLVQCQKNIPMLGEGHALRWIL